MINVNVNKKDFSSVIDIVLKDLKDIKNKTKQLQQETLKTLKPIQKEVKQLLYDEYLQPKTGVFVKKRKLDGKPFRRSAIGETASLDSGEMRKAQQVNLNSNGRKIVFNMANTQYYSAFFDGENHKNFGARDHYQNAKKLLDNQLTNKEFYNNLLKKLKNETNKILNKNI